MSMDNLSDSTNYDPNNLLNALINKMKLKNDAALSRVLGVAPPVISKIRHCQIPIGAVLLLRMHEESGLSIKDLRQLMGDRREKFRTIPVERQSSGQERRRYRPVESRVDSFADMLA